MSDHTQIDKRIQQGIRTGNIDDGSLLTWIDIPKTIEGWLVLQEERKLNRLSVPIRDFGSDSTR